MRIQCVVRAVLLVGACLVGTCLVGTSTGRAADLIEDAKFASLHKLIKPGVGESRWMEIAWYPSVWEARQRAAAEGKPIFLMAGSGGAPAAGC